MISDFADSSGTKIWVISPIAKSISLFPDFYVHFSSAASLATLYRSYWFSASKWIASIPPIFVESLCEIFMYRMLILVVCGPWASWSMVMFLFFCGEYQMLHLKNRPFDFDYLKLEITNFSLHSETDLSSSYRKIFPHVSYGYWLFAPSSAVFEPEWLHCDF